MGVWLVKHSEISSALTYTHTFKCRGAKRKLMTKSDPIQSFHSSLIYAHKLTTSLNICPEKLKLILTLWVINATQQSSK